MVTPPARKARPRRRSEDSTPRSPAISVVVYDTSGKDLSDDIAAAIINSIDSIVKQYELALSFTRT